MTDVASGGGKAGSERELIDVWLLELPVALWARSAEHGDELMREFTLIAAGRAAGVEHDVPARLVALVDELTATFGEFSAGPEERLARAVADGVETLDLAYQVPPMAGPAARHLGELFEEADAYCLAGEHLLTLTTPPDQAELRRWYLAQFIDQVAGAPPVPWPRWRSEHPY
jgi:hypothetical protein